MKVLETGDEAEMMIFEKKTKVLDVHYCTIRYYKYGWARYVIFCFISFSLVILSYLELRFVNSSKFRILLVIINFVFSSLVLKNFI